MAIIKAISSHASISIAIDYVGKREKTKEKYLSGIGVSPETAKDEMQATKELYGKTSGRTYKHFVQSFAPEEKIEPYEAHKIASAFAEKCGIFKGFEILIATHQDCDHIHSHFIVNSVNYKDGHKFQMSSKDLQKMKDLSDEICKEYGFSVCEKGKNFNGKERTGIVAWTKEKYQYLQKVIEDGTTKTYLEDIATTVKYCMESAKSKEEFVSLLNRKGYSVDWQDKHKHLTFQNSEGNKVRDTNLCKTFNLEVGKKELESKFKENTMSSEQERILLFIRQAIISQFLIQEYIDTKKELDYKIQERRIRVEVTNEKETTAKKAIKGIKDDTKCWRKELEDCSYLQIKKKYDLQEKIEHGNTLIESIKIDCDGFLEKYGFNSVKEMKEYTDDFHNAEEAALFLEHKVIKEQETLGDYIYTIKNKVVEFGAEVNVQDIELQSLEAQLMKEYGDHFSDEKLKKAEQHIEEMIEMRASLQEPELCSTDENFKEKKVKKECVIENQSEIDCENDIQQSL